MVLTILLAARHKRAHPMRVHYISQQFTVPDHTGIRHSPCYHSVPGGQWLPRRALAVVMMTLQNVYR